MKNERRKFLKVTGAVTAGSLLLPPFACTSAPQEDQGADESTAAIKGDLDQFGIQLYTLRDDMPKDPQGVLKQIADFGYTQVEGYEGDMGMFWGMSHLDFKKYMDDLGMSFVASHCNIDQDFEKKAAQAAEIGMKYLICPWIGPQKDLDAWKAVVDKFNAAGEVCGKNGIRFAYHNHGYTFQEVDGILPQDYLLENVDPAHTDFEMDMYWVVTGGADITEYLKKYPNRFRLCHVKDRLKDAPTEEQEASATLGTGGINYPEILKIAKDQGMEYFILEQERYDGTTPLGAAEAGANYLKDLTFS